MKNKSVFVFEPQTLSRRCKIRRRPTMESNELPSTTITPNDDPLCSLQPAGTDERPF